MRLGPRQTRAVREAARADLGERPTVRVFGSRVHDHLEGGDLDLYLEVEPDQATFVDEMAFRDLIERRGLKVDVVLRERGAALTPIDEMALRDSVLL